MHTDGQNTFRPGMYATLASHIHLEGVVEDGDFPFRPDPRVVHHSHRHLHTSQWPSSAVPPSRPLSYIRATNEGAIDHQKDRKRLYQDQVKSIGLKPPLILRLMNHHKPDVLIISPSDQNPPQTTILSIITTALYPTSFSGVMSASWKRMRRLVSP
jgi:hypothetical protein